MSPRRPRKRHRSDAEGESGPAISPIGLAFVSIPIAGVFLLLGGRLAQLQLAHAGTLAPRFDVAERRAAAGKAPAERIALDASAARRQVERSREIPAPRGTVLDRSGRILAVDRRGYEVRARLTVANDERGTVLEVERFLEKARLAFTEALLLDPKCARDEKVRAEVIDRLRKRIRTTFSSRLKLAGVGLYDELSWRNAKHRELFHFDLLLDGRVDNGLVLDRLVALEQSDPWRNILRIDRIPRWFRERPRYDVSHHVLGWMTRISPRDPLADPRKPGGRLEKHPHLEPGEPGYLAWEQDVTGRELFAGVEREPEPPALLRTTMDLELQDAAVRFLEEAVEVASDGHQPIWGALMLVDVHTGGVLAMASWRQLGSGPGTPNACVLNTYAPGSVVKPLVFATALGRGRLQWTESFDCTPTGGGYRYHSRRMPEIGRTLGDVTASGVLLPAQIIQRSSNIGAALVGHRLTQEDYAAYYNAFGWGSATGVRWLKESWGRSLEKAWGQWQGMSESQWNRYRRVALSIGYAFDVTPAQLARAYLRLLSGKAMDLHLVQGEGADPRGLPEALPGWVRQTLVDAMAGVVTTESGATGSRLAKQLLEQGVDPALFGGKSGSANVPLRQPKVGPDGKAVRDANGKLVMEELEVQNASFVGFTPVEDPRYLAVCVLQKPKTSGFYGGRYASPAAGKLLLHAMRHDRRIPTRSDLDAGQHPEPSGPIDASGRR